MGTTITDSGLTPDTSYSYTVVAKGKNGMKSKKSNPLTVKTAITPTVTVPDTPVNLTTTSITDTTVDLTWDDVTHTGGIQAYEVYRDGSLVGSPTTNSYSDTGLTASTQYKYTVVAVGNNNESSSESDELIIETTA